MHYWMGLVADKKAFGKKSTVNLCFVAVTQVKLKFGFKYFRIYSATKHKFNSKKYTNQTDWLNQVAPSNPGDLISFRARHTFGKDQSFELIRL